ncbi:MAG: hypothetical protein ACREMC_03495 [Gemmatimonadales bacterium]
MPGRQRRHRRLTQAGLTLLLLIQALSGGAVTLAHAQDVVAAPAAVEKSHDARCPVLHDALRCALCQYTDARVVPQQTVVTIRARPARVLVPQAHRVIVAAASIRYTAPPRAPPSFS